MQHAQISMGIRFSSNMMSASKIAQTVFVVFFLCASKLLFHGDNTNFDEDFVAETTPQTYFTKDSIDNAIQVREMQLKLGMFSLGKIAEAKIGRGGNHQQRRMVRN